VKSLRYAAVLALVVVAGLAAGVARATSSPAPVTAACTTEAIGQAFNGALSLDSIDAWGCEGDFAYTWATVGSGQYEIGVTEVLRFDASAQHWTLVSRLTYCHPDMLPARIYRLGCFSN
jgi:hypothetical protein